MQTLQDLPVLVLGLGISGLAMARWCARHGARVTAWDSRADPPGAQALAAEWPAVTQLQGELAAEMLGEHRLVLRSPGLAPTDARIAELVRAAQAAGVRIEGELGLFARALAGLKQERGCAPQLLAITGTNGKTTTTALTALLVKRAGRSVVAAGNIGDSMLDQLAHALDADALPQVWVLELSSFQLEGIEWPEGVEPAAAVVLNVTQDHLDWHGTMAAYGAAKQRIYGPHSVMVINRDDPIVAAMEPAGEPAAPRGPKPPKGAPKPPPRTTLRYGLDAPQRPGDYGLVVENGMAWLVRALPSDEPPRRGKPPVNEELHLQRLMPADALRLRGRHNAGNALAALALASAIGCPLAPMLHGLREYAGEPHRVQFVAGIPAAGGAGEVEAFDDSKGTNVGATVAALEGLGADKAPGRLVVILGGDGKGQDFSPLAAPVAKFVRAVALIGRDAAAIEAAIAGTGVLVQRQATLEQAVPWCFAQAQPGDAVLLSPACASLDMFRNYGHRAEVFVAAVRALVVDAGGVVA